MLEDIKGVGPKVISNLNKLGIYTIKDLIEYYPYRYEILKRTDLNSEKVVIDGYLEENAKIFRYGKKDRLTFRFNTGSNIINVIIFNRGFLKGKLLIGIKLTLIGKYDIIKNTLVASDLRFSLLPEKTIIEPIYHETKGITSKQINNIIVSSYNYVDKVDSVLPDYLVDKYKFLDKYTSIKEIHNPTSTSNYNSSLNRLKFEELYEFMYKINILKNNKKLQIGLKRSVDYKKIEEVINNLPFKLTGDQIKAIKEIYTDLISPKRMNRLLEGDVGSGKTIVSFIALYINYLSGYEGALMAPTEILAVQHYNNITKLFPNLKVSLLTGKLTVKEKKEIYKKIENKEVDIIIGTSALIQDNIKYNNLGLVITDEQHRFGVNQRATLKNKGITPDVLYMSATPIPRTYALVLYGDMDVSIIKEKPSGRIDVKTSLYDMKHIKDALIVMYKELKNNHQVYVVSPIIEDDENELMDVYRLEEELGKAFKDKNIKVLHGKMKNDEKEKIMNDFKNNKINILISTTVIEVGVDVPNATVMAIFDAYKFGLSTLHQLRGRVGRSNLESYCLLISDKESKRLDILTKTNDGYKISEEDFKLRGSGDLLGIRQSGDMSFKLVNLERDYNILLKAKEEVEYSLNNNLIDIIDIDNLA